MDFTIPVLLLYVWLFLVIQLCVVSRELPNEDLELENQIKLLNKPSIATIWTKDGEEYDCVDFYKQRAFDHPMLKNHNFHAEMTPSSHRYSSTTHHSFSDIWLNGIGCPTGSIPVQKVTKDDLIRLNSAEKIYAQTYNPTRLGEQGVHYAVMHTNTSDSGTKLYGAGMKTSVYNPTVRGAQYSSSQVKLYNGVETIEAGWTVNPSLYNNNRTRLFIYTNTGTMHCFNTYCPGFVSTAKDVPLGSAFTPISHSGGDISVEQFNIRKDGGNWWLQIGVLSKTAVGFWPETIFTSLKEFASHAEWGGKVYSPPRMPSPPMGAGNIKLRRSQAYDAFCKAITIVDTSYTTIVATKTSSYADIEQYKIEDIDTFDDEGHAFVFGGPGGYIGN